MGITPNEDVSELPSNLYYVYVLMRPDGNPFYVGKGIGDRIHAHEREVRKGCRCHKCNVIRKIWTQGGNVKKSIIFTTRSEAKAYEVEAQTIAQFGRRNLTNKDSGQVGFLTGRVLVHRQRAGYENHLERVTYIKKVFPRSRWKRQIEAYYSMVLEGLKRDRKTAILHCRYEDRARIEMEICALRARLGRPIEQLGLWD